MYDLPQQTLYSYLENPILDRLKFDQLPVSELVDAIKNFKKSSGSNICPEKDAIKFYLSNHALHLIKKKYNELEYLPKEVAKLVEDCSSITTDVSQRIFYHIASVGHGMLWVSNAKGNSQYDYFESSYGSEFRKYLDEKNSREDLSYIKKYNMSINVFLNGISSVFSFGKIVAWGKPYSMIIKVASHASQGRESLHIMADHAWSLCHNGGTILNKGIGGLYNAATDYLFDILDVQDSGQIPQWVKKESIKNKYIDKEIINLYEQIVLCFPEVKEYKLDPVLLKVSTDKRVAAHELMNKQYRQWWNNPGIAGGAMGGMADQEKRNNPPQAKIDSILIDTFKNNKWI